MFVCFKSEVHTLLASGVLDNSVFLKQHLTFPLCLKSPSILWWKAAQPLQWNDKRGLIWNNIELFSIRVGNQEHFPLRKILQLKNVHARERSVLQCLHFSRILSCKALTVFPAPVFSRYLIYLIRDSLAHFLPATCVHSQVTKTANVGIGTPSGVLFLNETKVLKDLMTLS